MPADIEGHFAGKTRSWIDPRKPASTPSITCEFVQFAPARSPENRRSQTADPILGGTLGGGADVETDLFETGILDSQPFAELLLQFEGHFSGRIDLDDFEIDNFRCIEKIASLILTTSLETKTD